MSSFTENVLSSDHKYVPAVDSITHDSSASTSEFFKLYRSVPENGGASPSSPPNTAISESQNVNVQQKFQSDNNTVGNFEKYIDSEGGLKSIASESSFSSVPYDTFGGNLGNSFISWKKSDFQSRSRLSVGDQVSGSQFVGLHPEVLDFSNAGSASDFYVQPRLPINNCDLENSAEVNLPKECQGSSWCPASWGEQNLGSTENKTGLDWDKSLQDLPSGVDSLFPHSEFEYTWRCRTESSRDDLSPHGRDPGSSRSDQGIVGGSTSHAQQDHQIPQKRRGRKFSATDSSPVDVPVEAKARDESSGINLAPGHGLSADDFDATTRLANEVAQMGFVANSSLQSLPTSDAAVLNQGLSATEKSRSLVQQTQPHIWPSSSMPQEDPSYRVVDPFIFNQKNNLYHSHPATSDQFTQHDTFMAFRSKTAGFSKAQGSFGYENDVLDPGQQLASDGCTGGGGLNDDQLWYYEDPQGRIQGEFSSTQMFSWLLAGRYFTSSLRIRRKCDDTFSTLHDYVQLFGHVPFTGATRIPPIRGGITPQVLLLVRMQGQQATAGLPFICVDQQQQQHKQSRPFAGDGNCVMDVPGAFGKNGLVCSNAAAVSQALLLKQFTEAITSNPGAAAMNFTSPLFSLLSEWIAKTRLDPSLTQGMNNSDFGSPGMCGPWPPQQQPQQIPAQHPMGDVFSVPDQAGGDLLCGVPQVPEATHLVMTSAASVPCDGSRSPKADRHNQTGGKNTEEALKHETVSQTKSKDSSNIAMSNNSPRQHLPLSSKPDPESSAGRQPPRAVSQSGCSSCSASSAGGGGGTWSTESLQFSSSSTGGRRLTSTPEQPQPAAPVRPVKNCWAEKSATVVAGARAGSKASSTNKTGKQSSSSPSTISSSNGGSGGKSAANGSSTAPSPIELTTQGPLDTESGKKKTKSCKQQQSSAQNGVKKSGTTATTSSKKTKSGASDNSALTEELTSLIRWVRSALVGIEPKEKFDIPTFVELLTTIDAPYEVESMIIAYLGNSSGSEQFVREFLDRRHTCWQLHRKQVEEMHNSSRSKKNHNSHQSASAPSSSEGGVCLTKAYSEPSDTQADSAWQQIKPKNCSNRRSKKGGKHRS
uniref:GYF domain-containing protein n=2 Tax=Mesocestoides corti TaxID=53468 RepID=A0A5K3EFE1_MESCO